MIKNFYLPVLFLLSCLPSIIAQNNHDGVISVEILNNSFNEFKQLHDSLPGLASAINMREELCSSNDMFLLDDANLLLLECKNTLDSIDAANATVNTAKIRLSRNLAFKGDRDEANSVVHRAIYLPAYTKNCSGYVNISPEHCDAISLLRRHTQKLKFILHETRKKVSWINSHAKSW